MQAGSPPRQDLYVPDRYEGLSDAGSGALRTIIVPVQAALAVVDSRFADMSAARRGSLMILRGITGAGKSTFLDTVGLFRSGVVTEKVSTDANVVDSLNGLDASSEPRIVVMEGREALGEVSATAIESAMHAINGYVRSPRGRNALVVWPTNTDDLTTLLQSLAAKLGGDALLGTGSTVTVFEGPPQSEFIGIAERTVATLNEGASLAALGISAEAAVSLAASAETIGQYLAHVRGELIRNGAKVRELLAAEQYRMWVLVVAGNNPEGDVAALTRGGFAYTDTDRLMTATGANIVKQLKEQPDQIGILSTVLDSKVLYLDMVTMLAVARQYGDDELHKLMRGLNMSTSQDKTAADRLRASELGLILAGSAPGTRKRGSKPGTDTQAAFNNLAKIARNSDGALNRAIGRGLQDASLIDGFEVERELGTSLKFLSDIYCLKAGSPFRLEVMWRTTTGRAEIANYTLTKLGNYGRAIGLLK